MKFLRHLCLFLLLGLTSCTYFANKFASSKKSPEDKRVGEAKVIGVIELVNPEQNYVLINCEHRVDIAAGTEIISQGINGTDAKLKVTPERKGNYITADITQGTPQLRDLVVYQIQRDAPPPPTTATASGAIVPLTPVMKADEIPPLDAPFQPMAPMQSTFVPSPAPAQAAPPPLRQAPLAPAPLPEKEPQTDLSKLPPVIR